MPTLAWRGFAGDQRRWQRSGHWKEVGTTTLQVGGSGGCEIDNGVGSVRAMGLRLLRMYYWMQWTRTHCPDIMISVGGGHGHFGTGFVISYWCCCGDVDGIVVDDGGCDCIGSWTRSSHGFELWIVVTDNGGHRNLVYAWRSRHRQGGRAVIATSP
ncbi:pollen-specific leucine-rich repeat extensin-like protein 3 [Iris pallida]|uniref:Pollen-specific leucine-rich repeat extensin-like protein 3 n=1 Tax=Iris pallida TaxID=29817 RepID=A0AAX6G2J7_IRIPA|nr:pollen-specific leucine-rich repeat extensin-like protein 3 [Iris pallida]